MTMRAVRLSDRLDLSQPDILINGTQALVRLMLMQAARDRAAGLAAGGFVTGYRGSPLGAVDRAMQSAGGQLKDAGVVFQAGLNEDLAATALWGTQTAALRGEGLVDGVFGLWYGKGPGVDRSGDALRHANLAGTAEKGGVVLVAGDDHTGESSTTCHQSELALIDAGIPILSPAGVQEILDFGLYGFALSRYSGLWAGLKAVKDSVESTRVVDGRPDRMVFAAPRDDVRPGDGLSIRLNDHWVAQEERLVAHKWPAARAFARANGIDRRSHGHAGAKLGIVAAGKTWLDVVSAFEILGLSASDLERIGLTVWKVAQVWPLEEEGLREWATGLSLVVVVEEKRKVIEPQIARALWGRDLRLWGERSDSGPLFSEVGALDPTTIALRLGEILVREGRAPDGLGERLAALAHVDAGSADLAARTPYFCAGCPHNSSTILPDGARAGGGIGCHTMALWMDRGTEGYTHMGAEGATWIGEAPFSRVPHVFQNLGDGTYNHSGLQAIRAAIAADVNITYKILFNDAVAMTGGQANEGGLTPERIAAEVLAAGARRVAIVHDGAEGVERRAFPPGVVIRHRDELVPLQEELSKIKGVSVLVHVQTCAAEKRRRRRKDEFPKISTRVFIDPEICEGCGDCGRQSNCVAILPLDTPLGRKRKIDQSSCNGDLSCLKGFCPALVSVDGATPRKPGGGKLTVPDLAAPDVPSGPCAIVVTGIGGTGAVTIGAVLAMAAHVEGKGAGVIEMAGLAQKGGAVHIHCRIADSQNDISAIRVSPGQGDLLIGGDLVTSAEARTLALLSQTASAVVNSHATPTGAFVSDPNFSLPASGLGSRLNQALGSRQASFDATRLAEAALGDAIFANMVLLGAAWQRGLVPLQEAALRKAIELNGAAVPRNLTAFDLGRWAVAELDAAFGAAGLAAREPDATVEDIVAVRERHLTAYQSSRLAARFRRLVDAAPDAELREAIAKGYAKLLAYKDEYEVARLLATTRERVDAAFDGVEAIRFHLAPPGLSGAGPGQRPRKRSFGGWMRPVFAGLSVMKVLRGTRFDPFGYTEERRMERTLIAQYEADMNAALPRLTDETRDAIIELAELPLQIRGFGPVKQANAERAEARRKELLADLDAPRAKSALAAE
ncbi:MAG: indolepyruvate ferredoxin oxidoreductase family protein [Pseudomonadota bacterium]